MKDNKDYNNVNDNSDIEMIQFHEYYSYEEFVRDYKKGLNGEDYIVVDGEYAHWECVDNLSTRKLMNWLDI